ncbi:MAG: peptidoglycan DD-metalloendopeptidase family protein [Actinomycetia bacterium]|nr:peptidoglycan DD-metalloendopeptidase family protein [Actinomycetes bacterium]
MKKKHNRNIYKIKLAILVLLMFSLSAIPTFAISYSNLREKAKSAEYQIKSIKKSLNLLADDYFTASNRLANINANITEIENEVTELEAKSDEHQDYINNRARFLYQSGSGYLIEVIFSALTFDEFLSRVKYFEILSKKDSDLYLETIKIRSELAEKRKEYEKQKKDYDYLTAKIKNKRKDLENKLTKEKRLYAQLKGDLTQTAKKVSRSYKGYRVSGFVFPVAGAHAFSNTFGAPRRGHRHQGNDIFALRGTYLVACVDGKVKLSSGGNGGIMLYIYGSDGNTYFYAHLNGYAKGIYSGKYVKAGQLVGYVGNTGNARGGSCHLHFEIRPGGGRAVNPYYVLREADK